MLPEPVDTESSTRPLTVRLRSNVASVASAGTAAMARTAVAIPKIFIVFLDSKAVFCDPFQFRLKTRGAGGGRDPSLDSFLLVHSVCQFDSYANRTNSTD